MLDQEIIWTALPNGIEERDGKRVLKLSIFVSPRLKPQSEEEGNLGHFQDFKNWTEKVKEMDFAVQFEHLGQSKTVEAKVADRNILMPSMWSKLFHKDTYIKAHEFDNYSEQIVKGNGIISLFELIKSQYQTAALDSLLDCNNSGGSIDDPHKKSFSILDKIPDECIHWDDNIARSVNEKFSKSFFLRRDAVKSNDIGKIELDIADVFLRFILFHHGPIGVPEDPGNLFNNIDFNKYVDFHQAISSLGDYPEIMRRLGLIIDIEVPADQVPAMSQEQIGKLKAVTSWKSSLGKPPIMLKTAFIWNGSRFETSPRQLFSSKIINGFLRLYPNFYLVSLDVDKGGLCMIHEAVRRRSDPPVNMQDENCLPSLRSDGISLTQNGRGEIASRKMRTLKHYNDALARGDSVLLYAEDTLRGYRVDIKDTSSGQWHSLCRREGTYSIEGSELNITDEGCIQLGMVQATTCSKDNELFINDSILTWRGWSLVAPRPGKSINADTSGSPVAEFANEPVTQFKLKTSFKAAPGSLPKLRFGTGYFLRARVVDIAGNSVSPEEEVSENSEIVLPSDPLGFKYLRYEPIISPTVIAVFPKILEGKLEDKLGENKGIYKPGESLERLVIRTKNTDLSLDGENEHSNGFSSPGISERYVVPPRTSQLMAETHGMFDYDYKLKADLSTYKIIVSKDSGKFPEWNGFPIGMHDLEEVPYLPDPLSRGAAIRNLPGTSEGTILRPNKGALIPIQLPGVKARSGSVTMINFGEASEWPNAKPFRLKLIEKLKDESPEPQWDEVKRHLTVKLPKAETATVLLSSYCEEEDLKIMGIWQWIKEYVDQKLKDSASVPSIDQIKELSDKLADLTQLALEGGFWMLTPNRKITLIHAVQQPIGKPEFKELSAARDPGSSFAYLLGVIKVHGKSTIKLDITSEWSEPVDMSELDPSSGPLKVKAYVGEVPLQIIDGPKPLELMSGNWVVGEYFPETDTIGFYQLPTKIHAPRHEFGDTKHRIVRYRATASSRFREYFSQDDDLDFTRTSDEIVVNIPSSARPAAPKVLYVIPTFGWKRQTSTNLIASERLGGGLRIYLERPWYSSGEGELLGVVLLNDLLQPDRNAEREKFKHYITQWGADPIWKSNSVPSLPKLENFPKRIYKEKDAYNLSLDETSEIKVGVAGHEVEYDPIRKLWYCDIDINTHKWKNGKIVDGIGSSYYPFIRLALARYQPNSISDAHLSKVVLADFVQIAPDRSVVVTYDPYNPAVLNVAVAGYSYKPPSMTPDNERIEVVIESLAQELAGDLGWKPEDEAKINRDIETASENLIWKGQVTLPPAGGQKFRLVLKEYEYLYVDDGESQSIGKRLVFVETIDL